MYEYVRASIDRLPESPTVVEAGSHHGSFVLAVLEARPNARIIAIEGSHENYQKLVRRVPSGANVECIHACVGAHTGMTTMYVGCETRAHSVFRSVEKHKTDKRATDQVRVVTLDEVCPKYQIDLLRLDCYGGEYEAMRTFVPLKRVTELLVTWHCKPEPFNSAEYVELRAYHADMLERMRFELVDGSLEETGKHMHQTWRAL